MNIFDRIEEASQTWRDAPALLVSSADGSTRVISYGSLLKTARDLARQLRSDGLQEGQRIGLLEPDRVAFIEKALGILAAGGCLVPISEDYAGSALDRFRARAGLHGLCRPGGAEPEWFDAPVAVDGSRDEIFRSLAPAYIRFTSGTTNERKGVVIGHAAIEERLQAANRGMRIGPGDRVLWVLPLAHHFVVSILLYLRFGATVLLSEDGRAASLLASGSRHRATVLYASPHHYDLFSEIQGADKLTEARLAISTSMGLSEEIAHRFFRRSGIPLTQALGAIEVGLPVMNLKAPHRKPLALGQVLPDYEVWLRDDGGQKVTKVGPLEGDGEIVIRGPGFFDAYLNPWIRAQEVMGGEGFRTGDQGYFDAEGDLHLLGRRRNRINVNGMKFFAEEVESVLLGVAEAGECRVLAQPDSDDGEVPVAEVVPRNGSNENLVRLLMDRCREQLAPHKVPRDIRLVTELPRTPTGKVRRW